MKPETLKEAIARHFKPGVRLNAFMSPEELCCDEGLSAAETEGGLFLLRERGSHRILNFWLTDPELPELPLGTVTEITARPNREDLELIKSFEDAGFRRLMSRVRLVREPGEMETPITPGVTVIKADGAKAALDLIINAFDPLTGCIPTVDELNADAVSGNLYLAVLDGSPVGVLQVRKGKNFSDIRHLAVREDMRGKRIAAALIYAFLDDTEYRRIFVWTGSANAAALKNYARCGFKPDGYTSQVLMKG